MPQHQHAFSPARRPGLRRRLAVLALAALIPLLAAGSAAAASIVVTINGVHSNMGEVVVALYNRAEGFPDGDYSIRHTKTKASTQPIVVTFPDLPPGRYAVAAYHDEESLGHFKTNFFGYPLDGYAISNGVRAIISRPRFEDAAFSVRAETTPVTLQIGY
jgi:uncharacterized protein (DUF2141 family)